MTNEARINSSLSVTKGDYLNYSSKPTAFNADVAGTKGPVVGSIEASLNGTDVDFTELTQPALCRIQNQDSTNFVTVGIWDDAAEIFYPMIELLPGESFVVRLSRDLQDEFGTGVVGTAADTDNRLRIRADTAAANVLVEAFEV